MIDTKALRSRVLDLAIRGKLTEQLESDGTAEELYQQIQTEKQKLIKEKKIKKEKPLPPIKPEEVPFEIPSNWKFVKFCNIISLQSGQDLQKNEYNDTRSGIPYITGASNYQFDGSLLINRWTETPKAFAEKGDILLSCKGTVGKITILTIDKVHIARQIMGIRSYISDNIFISLFVQSKVNGIISASKGLIPGIERKDILNMEFPLPPLAEQKRIVARVEEIFRILDTIDKAQEKYSADVESLKAKLITAGIQGKLTEQLESDGTAEELYQQIQTEKQKLIKEGKIKKEKPLPSIKPEEVPFEIPSSWKWVRLKSLGQFSSGKTPSMAESAFWDGSIAWVSSKDMKKTVITDSEMHVTELAAKDMKIYPAGTLLLVARSGILRHSLPLCVLGVESTINQDIKAFSLYDTSLSKWVYFALKGFESYIIRELVKAMTTVESLKFEEFSNMLIPLPPLAEQKRIADKLDELLIAMQ